MPRPLSVAALLATAAALGLAQGQQAPAADVANDTAAGCCRGAPGAAGHPAAAADAAAGPAPAHALLLPGAHLRLLRRHEGAGARLRPHRLHEPHVRPVRVRAGGGRADGRRLSLPAEPVSEEPAAGVHAGAGAVPAVDGHVPAAVGRVHAGPQPARLPRHGGAPAAGARAGAALRLHGDGPRRRCARQAGRRGAAARGRADGGGWRRRRLRRGHRGPEAGLGGDGRADPVAVPAARDQPQHGESTAQPLPELGAGAQGAQSQHPHTPTTTEPAHQHAPLKTRRSTNFIAAEPHQLPVVKIGDVIGVLHSSLSTNIYSPSKPTNYTLTQSTGDNSNVTDILNAAEDDLGKKSEGLMAVFLSYLRGTQAHSGTRVLPKGTVTNVIKNNTFTKTVFQHLAHIEHSNHTLTTTSEHPTLSNTTKVTTKIEEKTMTASQLYAQFEAQNSTAYSDNVHTVPPADNLSRLPMKPLINRKNGTAFAIFSVSDKLKNPFPIILPMFHKTLTQSLKNQLSWNNSQEDTTSTFPCSQNSHEAGNRIKCSKGNTGSLSDTRNEIAHGTSALRPQHVRVKRSSISPVHILENSAGQSARDVQPHRPKGSEDDQRSPASKHPPPDHDRRDFPAQDTRWTADGGEAIIEQLAAELLPQHFRIQARQAWGSMLGVMWCAAGVLFSGPSFWNVMGCLLQAGQAFFG